VIRNNNPLHLSVGRRGKIKKKRGRKEERMKETACDREKGEPELKRVTWIAKFFFLKTQKEKLITSKLIQRCTQAVCIV
jgi:hypothetical protein